MPVELEMPESIENANFLEAEGTFHCAVLSASENPTKQDGSLISNAAFSAELEVLAGPHKGKAKSVTFFNPKPEKKGSDGYEMDLRKQRRFLEAVMVAPERVPGGKSYTVDVMQSVGRQLIITFANNTYDGKTKLQLNYADIWHIDDPSAKPCERDQGAIKLLPAALRRKPESFVKADAGKPASSAAGSATKPNGSSSSASSQSQQQSAPVAAAATVDVGDLV